LYKIKKNTYADSAATYLAFRDRWCTRTLTKYIDIYFQNN